MMIFEMMYYISIVSLTPRNKLEIHAKCQTIMVKDMQLLRDLWQRIDPTSSIGADDADMVRQKRVWHAQEERRIAKAIINAKNVVARAKANNRMDNL